LIQQTNWVSIVKLANLKSTSQQKKVFSSSALIVIYKLCGTNIFIKRFVPLLPLIQSLLLQVELQYPSHLGQQQLIF
jgi:hypothetical protein